MRTFLFKSLTIMFSFFIYPHGAYADQLAGVPIGFVSGCEIDLNADGVSDSALLIHTSHGYELVVLMRVREQTKSYIVNSSQSKRFLTCEYGKQIRATSIGKGKDKGTIYQTNGTYLLLTQPESSSAAYFWLKDKFKEVWISD
jgi:hypothetical protein